MWFQVFLISLVHIFVPSHWLPLVLIGRAERWEMPQLLGWTALVAAAHIASSLAIGVAVFFLGRELFASHGSLMMIAAPLLLIGLGVMYLASPPHQHPTGAGRTEETGEGAFKILVPHEHTADCDHPSHRLAKPAFVQPPTEEKARRSGASIVASLALAMLLSPCVELQAVILTASKHGFGGFALVAVIYASVTLAGMLSLVALASKGMMWLRWTWLEEKERWVTGVLLILLGITAFFFRDVH